ncbi:ATP-binding protein [Polyangium aurulentum]|uniref:GAF domain-containing sensor histidine kinase n=1 Tax=Polyangium aurulentum TaxID=2567896 RepID=UPI00146F66B2|nr:ATP-binding protein [Polyangium aurulentum]UQA56432.1 GAF domain-containing protein [Polyangium aurulentum]
MTLAPRMQDPPVQTSPSHPRDATPEVEALRREVERLRVIASKDRGVLETILEASPHGIVVCDAQGQVVLHNRASERIWAGSVTLHGLESWSKYRAFHPDGRPFASEDWALAKCLATHAPVELTEVHIQRFDDTFGYILASSAPIFGEGDQLEGAISVFVDVTRLKQSELAAQRLQVDLAAKVRDLEAFARRASLLQKITSALSRAGTVQEIADVVTSHGQELFGATSSLVFLLEDFGKGGRTLELTSCVGASGERLEGYRRLPLDADMPLPYAVRTGEPVWLCNHDEVFAAFPSAARFQRGDTRLEGVAALPLRTTGAIIGGLAFSFYAPPNLDPVARDFILTVANQCGLAIERAVAFEAERRAREALQAQQDRLAVVAQATERLVASLDSRHALSELARHVVPRLADWCAIDELAPDGSIRRLAVAHRDPAKVSLAHEIAQKYPPRPGAAYGVSAVLRTGKTEWVPDIPDEILVATSVNEEHLALARSLGLTSYAIVPLLARGRILGALTLVSEAGRRLVPEDLTFAEELARRAAMALDNARLYEAAEAARRQLHRLFMEAPAGVCLLRGPEHRFNLANAPYLRLASRGEDVIGRTLREVFPELSTQGIYEILDRVYATGETFVASELPLNIDAGDGQGPGERIYTLVYQATRDGGGVIDGIAVFAFEVTDQVRARRRVEALAADVARNEARMRALVEATAAIVWTATPRGEVVEPSPSWTAFTGQSGAEFVHGGFLQAIHPDDRQKTLAVWTEATAASAPYAVEYRLRRQDGSYASTLARGMPVLGPDGKTIVEYVGCNVDVSDLRRAEAEAREHADNLAATNRELDQFAYVTSHDLKAPLRAIGSLAEWIEEDLGAAMTEDVRQKMNLLRGRVRRMEALIQGILDFSRAGRLPSKRERVDVRRLAAEIVDMLGLRPPATVVLGDTLPTLETERVALQQILMNLISNALKHARRPDVEVRVDARDVGEAWEFCVRDNGPGIAPEYHDRVWGIFQTLEARDKVESTGIGLAIVKKIIEGRGGRVWIASAPGEGASFFFTWPKREGRRT